MHDNNCMATPSLILFDDGKHDFGPLCDLRPCFDLRTGALTTRQRIEQSLGIKASSLHVPQVLHELALSENASLKVNQPLSSGLWLLVNGRVTPQVALPTVNTIDQPVMHLAADGQLLWALLSHEQAGLLIDNDFVPQHPVVQVITHDDKPRLLYDRPWHVLDSLDAALQHDLATWASPQVIQPLPGYVHTLGTHPIHVINARLQPGVVLNAEAGPIAIEPDAIIGAHSVIEGPCYVGPHTQLAAHTYLRPHTILGPSCKVAGEISFSIVQGFSNKAHLGYLGHSLVGQWVNLGAATTVSNLKNTYGSIRIQLHPDQPAENTQRHFHGPIIGDFVRTAIGSRLLTGSCVNTGAMLALSGYAPKCAKAFGFYTDESPDGADHQPDKFIATATAMIARRKLTMSPALETRLRVLMRG